MSYAHPVQFFFGADTPSGFYGYHKTDLYDPRDGWVAFLIKSGAGTGKATFMRAIADEWETLGISTEIVLCSSDPSSIDAVIAPDIKLCIIDATSPHIIEPYAYGECEQLVPFGCCLKTDVTLSQTAAWFEATDACADSHARCQRFLAAAHSLLENNRRIAAEHLLSEKLTASAVRLANREFGSKQNGHGKNSRRFLSAITPEGHRFLQETACALCPKLYVLEDEYGVMAPLYTSILLELANKAGLDTVSCACPLSPDTKTEHLLIPSLGLGFVTSNSYHTVDIPVFRRIHASRFLQNEALKSKKQQLGFNRRAAAEMIGEAVRASADAKVHHDRMEALHKTAMDWEMWEKIAAYAKSQILTVTQQRLS